MARNTLNWGILSAGRIADKFTSDMKFVKNGNVHAVAARRLTDATDFAKRHDIPNAYEGYDALFSDPNIDIIYIATPHNFHFEQTKAALLAGKSVLCEKPITTSPEDCLTLQTLAEERGLFLMEAMWTYFLPAVQQAQKWVEEGRIGKIKHIKADFGYPVPFDADGRMYNAELAGGCLFDMGIYPLAIAHLFNPAPLSDIKLNVKHAATGVDNDLAILADANEVVVSLATSFQCRLQNAALIIGDKGYIHIPNFWRAKSCSLFEMDHLQESYHDELVDVLGYCHEAEAVGDMVLSNLRQHPLMPLSTSHALQVQMAQIRDKF